MRVRKWMKVQKDRTISLDHSDVLRLGTNNLEKIIKLSTRSNKLIIIKTQDIKEIINSYQANA